MTNATALPALLPIVRYGDPILVTPAKSVKKIDAALARLIPAMFRTMYEEPGIGLAAPQVGVSLRLMVVDVAPDGKSRPMVLINPTFSSMKGRVKSEEGCLSFPGIQVVVPRADTVTLNATNERGLPVTVEADGLLSRCLQHEMDHLDGITMIDRLTPVKRFKALWDIRRQKKAGLW